MTEAPTKRRLRRGFTWRFGLRSLLVAVFVTAVVLGWLRDHRDLIQRLELSEMRRNSLERAVAADRGKQPPSTRWSGGFRAGGGQPLTERFKTAEAYLAFVETFSDFQEVEASFWLLNLSPLHDEVVEGFLEMLDSADVESRRRAVAALESVQVQPEPAVTKLIPLLDDSHRDIQRRAVSAIRRHGQAAAAALPALRRHAENDKSLIAADALLAVSAIDPESKIGKRLVELLSHSDKENRCRSITMLPVHVDPHQVEHVLSGLFHQERDGAVRKLMVEALNEARLKALTQDRRTVNAS